MKIREYEPKDKSELTKLISQFRVALAKLKGIERELNLRAAEEELEFYQKKKYPIFIAEEINCNLIGFHVCRIQDKIIWSESLYVIPEERRKGVASALYEKAENLAEEIGCETVYNWVHPNNFRSIPFLKKRGYTVLNLIEVCKKRSGEKLTQKIKVGSFEFDY
ncbi:MAG: GNAT family N-acetyltransferase [Promethearchaeota archaeon]|nr:MAG: GNAT family N-acetyltransferase [Candidatus Lokiarchaeota archaeon]